MSLSSRYEFYRELFPLLMMEPMNRHTSFKVGGPADFFALPETIAQIKDLIIWGKQKGLKLTFIGGGSNLLVADQGLRGLVISLKALSHSVRVIDQDQHIIEADAGKKLSTVVKFAIAQGLAGLEFAAGIPGTIGGAVMMNAGGSISSIEQVIYSLIILDIDTLKIYNVDKKYLNFSYRQLDLSRSIILRIQLKLTHGNTEELQQIFEHNLKVKSKSQPLNQPSCGCFFKNPSPDQPAGLLIDQAGLKKMAVNDAVVSPIHANYIVNRGKATCADILRLAEKVRQKVFDKFQILLKTEVKIVGYEENIKSEFLTLSTMIK